MTSRRSALGRFVGLAAGSLLVSSPSRGQEPNTASDPWEYHDAYGGAGRWYVSNYKAVVRWATRTEFHAEVREGERLARRISGKLRRDGSVEAVLQTLASDAGDEQLHGTYSRQRQGSVVYEIFSLGNQYRLVGLTRASQAGVDR
jgi:hypothetical protein